MVKPSNSPPGRGAGWVIEKQRLLFLFFTHPYSSLEGNGQPPVIS